MVMNQSDDDVDFWLKVWDMKRIKKSTESVVL